ncbi:MAG: hypothetical protein OXK73_12290 [Rhodospirillaceae bacterium]|nr:hypothetical protein [Rhodospirillaceae bacterium]
MSRSLLPYQRRWVADDSQLKIVEKSRRIGLSWAEAYDAVMHAAEGKGNVTYQSYDKEMTRGFIDDCAEWAEHLDFEAGGIGESVLDFGDSKAVQVFRIQLASGKTITSMTSAPRALRSKGRPGDRAIVDEAAFVDDLEEVLKAALAFLTWGGRVHVISTHNGEASPFNLLLRDVRDDKQPGSVHTITFRQAIDDGLGRRIFEVTGREWSPEAEAAWEAGIRSTYGHRGEEELDCIPSAGSGAWLTWDAIRACEDRTGKAGKPEHFGGGIAFVGVDVARRKDLWVAGALERVGDVLWLRELVVRQGIRFSEQRKIVGGLAARYRPVRIAVDQTGMGEAVVEQLQDDHGSMRVDGVLMTGPRRLDVATALREAVEDQRLRIPPDDALRRDLHSIRAEAGPTGQPRLLADTGETDGHADRFWALALACSAAAERVERFGFHRIDNHRDTSLSPLAVSGRRGRAPSMRWQPGGLA